MHATPHSSRSLAQVREAQASQRGVFRGGGGGGGGGSFFGSLLGEDWLFGGEAAPPARASTSSSSAAAAGARRSDATGGARPAGRVEGGGWRELDRARKREGQLKQLLHEAHAHLEALARATHSALPTPCTVRRCTAHPVHRVPHRRSMRPSRG